MILFSYFASKRGLDDTVGFSCNDVVNWCGYKVNHTKDKSNQKITDIINSFAEGGYINVEGDISRNNYVKAILNIYKFDAPSQFALIYLDEIEKIRDFQKYTEDTKKMSASILLLLLSYLRVNMLRRQKDYIGKQSDKPEFCYRMYIDIEKDIGISSRYISRAIRILEELDLIAIQTLPRWKDVYDNWHTEVTLFVNKYKRIDGGKSLDMHYDYKQELQWGSEYIKEKKFLSKKFYQNTEIKE